MKFEFVYFFNFKQENFNDNHLNMHIEHSTLTLKWYPCNTGNNGYLCEILEFSLAGIPSDIASSILA